MRDWLVDTGGQWLVLVEADTAEDATNKFEQSHPRTAVVGVWPLDEVRESLESSEASMVEGG